MGSQRFIFTLIGLFVLSPLSIAQGATAEAVTGGAAEVAPESAVDDNWMEERIQKFRETIRQRKEDAAVASEKVRADAVAAEKQRTEAAASTADSNSTEKTGMAASTAPAVTDAEKEMDARVSAESAWREQYREAMDKQREARQAQARERRAARELQYEARMERWLQQQEERQQQAVARHEAMRNQAEEEHNFLVKNHEDMLQKALQEKIDVANRHEELRKEADKRRKKFAATRAAIRNMKPAERREYMDKHREEIFADDTSPRPPAMPAAPRFGGMYNQPPWYR